MNYFKFTYIIYFLVIIVSCKNGNNNNKNSKKNNTIVPVDIIIADKEDYPTKIEVNGTVLSEEMIELHPEVSGRLVFLNIPDGGFVKAGTVLAKINDTELQAELQQQKVQLELAKKTEQRMKKLLSVNGVDQATYDAALSQVNVCEANINVINAQIDKTVIKASFNGHLGLRLVSVGAYVTPSTIIGSLSQTDKIKIDFTIPESYQNLINIGKSIYLQSTSSNKKILATITAIEPQINISTRNIKVRAKSENNELKPGAFVKVLIENNSNSIVAPTNAIIPDAASNQLILIKKGKALLKNVETGIRTANVVEIVKGVEIGDSIVISGVLYVRPNSALKIKSVKKIETIVNQGK